MVKTTPNHSVGGGGLGSPPFTQRSGTFSVHPEFHWTKILLDLNHTLSFIILYCIINDLLTIFNIIILYQTLLLIIPLAHAANVSHIATGPRK